MQSRNYVTDQDLVDRLSLNDTGAFEELYRRYWHPLYIYGLKKLYSSDDARRIVKEIYIELWENRHQWPQTFSVAQHLYERVRANVVKSLHSKLANGSDQETMQQHILPGFSTQSLQAARTPVSSLPAFPDKHTTVGLSEINERQSKLNPIEGLRWLIQTVNAKLN